MPGQSFRTNRIAVALATVDDLPVAERAGGDADRLASRVAAHRAIHAIAGVDAAIDLRRRANRSPLAVVRRANTGTRTVAVSVSHCDGRAAAIAAAGGQRIGIDVERLESIDLSREHFFLTPAERQNGLGSIAMWVLKESVWKALGLGGAVPFHALQLHVNAEGAVAVAVCGGRRFRVAFTLAAPWSGYIMATAHLEAR